MLRIFLVVVALCLTACSPGTVKIGVALPLSGGSTPRGQEILNAVLLAVEDVNQTGGVKGRRVELVIQDDGDAPQKGRTAAENLVQAGVVGVIGHYSSNVTLSALPVYVQAETALISPAATLSRLPQEGHYFFRTIGNNAQQAHAAVQYVAKARFQRIALVHNRSLYGQDMVQQLERQLGWYAQFQVRSYVDQPGNNLNQTFQREMPELIYYAGGYRDAALFFQNLRESGHRAALMGGNTLHDPEFVRLVGTAVAQGIWVTSAQPELPQSFVSRYKQRFGQPGLFSAYAYDATRLLLSAAESAKNLTSKDVVAQLSAQRSFESLSGTMPLRPAQRINRQEFELLEIAADGSFAPAQVLLPRFQFLGKRWGEQAKAAVSPSVSR